MELRVEGSSLHVGTELQIHQLQPSDNHGLAQTPSYVVLRPVTYPARHRQQEKPERKLVQATDSGVSKHDIDSNLLNT